MRRRPVQRAFSQNAHFPAPMGGLNTISGGTVMPISDCLSLVNLIAAETGLRSRFGWREWVTGLGSEVRSTIPFMGSTPSKNRLFACTNTGIWDVSVSTTTPTQVIAFADTAGDAGYGISHVVLVLGGHFLFYADERNGLFLYTESTDTWTQVASGVGAGQISVLDPANIVFVTFYKQRVWFVERDTANAWYLPAGQTAGVATRFSLGTKFRAGGSLVGLWDWTADGGVGLDDALVFVSSGGDIVIYSGVDPATDFLMKGVWFAGGLVSGRRIANNFGGDLLLLSKLGALPLSKLISGGSVEDISQYETAKISNFFNVQASQKSQLHNWAMYIHPEDNALLITVPTADGYATEQLAFSLTGRSWSYYRDLPIFSGEVWDGKFYFGTADGRMCINDGYVDGVLLADPNAYTAIAFSILTSFQKFGSANKKRIHFIRPQFRADAGSVSYVTKARFDFDTTVIAEAAAGGAVSTGAWDSGTWDSALWADSYLPSKKTTGGSGMGSDIAIALKGTAISRTVLVGIDIVYDSGGFL